MSVAVSRQICALSDRHKSLSKELEDTLAVLPSQWNGLSSASYACLVRQCGNTNSLAQGKLLQLFIVYTHGSDRYLENLLVEMYAKCGALDDAGHMFDRILERNIFTWNIMIGGYARHDQQKQSIQIFRHMHDIIPDKFTYTILLNLCSCPTSLYNARWIHADILKSGHELEIAVTNALISAYGKCGSIQDAWRNFLYTHEPNIISWNGMIGACMQNDYCNEGLQLFIQMKQEGTFPNKISYINILDACTKLAALAKGKWLHACTLDCSLAVDLVVGTRLVDMYAKCGSINDARIVFAEMHCQDVVSWNAIIAAFGKNGYIDLALEFFWAMQREKVMPDVVTWINMLDACTCSATITQGKLMHAFIMEHDCQSNVVVGASLVHMYGKCGSVKDAYEIFERIAGCDAVLWNILLGVYGLNCNFKEVVHLFHVMLTEDSCLNDASRIHIINACAYLAAVTEGKLIHACLLSRNCASSLIIANSLVTLYGKFGWIEDSEKILVRMQKQDVVSWNAIIAIYAQNGYGKLALQASDQMLLTGLLPDAITFISMLDACMDTCSLVEGKKVHACIVLCGHDSDDVLDNVLLNMYSKCQSLNDAISIFNRTANNLDMWASMVVAYAKRGYVKEVCQLLQQMRLYKFMPSRTAFASVLDACADIVEMAMCKQMHAWILNYGFELDIILANALLSMYGKCGSVHDARWIFDMNPQRNMVSWTAMITAYAQNRCGKEAIQLFHEMQVQDIIPDEITFVSVLDACSVVPDLAQGKQVHAYILSQDNNIGAIIGTALLNMYGKCGRLEDAKQTFDRVRRPNEISWNAMVTAYAQQGQGAEAFLISQLMMEQGITPTYITFISILSVCSHTGLVVEGCQYFSSMSQVHHIVPTPEHFSCIVDLLARHGLLDEAADLVQNMPLKANETAWTALLSFCSLSNNKQGEGIVQHALASGYNKCGMLSSTFSDEVS